MRFLVETDVRKLLLLTYLIEFVIGNCIAGKEESRNEIFQIGEPKPKLTTSKSRIDLLFASGSFHR